MALWDEMKYCFAEFFRTAAPLSPLEDLFAKKVAEMGDTLANGVQNGPKRAKKGKRD